jgi:hypothetical protein
MMKYFVGLVIAVLLIWVVGYEIVYKKIGGGTSDATKSFTECNSDLKKCACFFTTGRCPSDATIPIGTKKTDKCPPDGIPCDQSNFAQRLKDYKGQQGTCCILDPNKPISESRLNQPKETPTAGTGGGAGSAQTDVDCTKISNCASYQSYPGYSEKLCQDDPCRNKGREKSDLVCFASSASTCVECEKDCKMDFYDKFGTNAANLKKENPCNCISTADLENQAKLACTGKSAGDTCGNAGTGEKCGIGKDGTLTCMPGCNYQGTIPGTEAFGYECLGSCACDSGFIPLSGEGFECKSGFSDLTQQSTCCVKAPPPNCCGITKCKHYSMDYYDNPDYCLADACDVGKCIPTFYPDEANVNPAFRGKYEACLDCSELKKPIDDCSGYTGFTKDPLTDQRICIEHPCTAGKCVPHNVVLSGIELNVCEDCPDSCDLNDFYSDTQSIEDPVLLAELKEKNPCGCT